jgi:hypothetical protein
MLCSLLKVSQCFRGTCHLCLKDWRISQAGSKKSSQLAEIPVFLGTKREMQGNKSVSNGLPIGQNEPVTMQEQLSSCHWLSHTTERTMRRQDQDSQHGLRSYIAIFWCKYLTQRLRLALVQTCWNMLQSGPPCPQCCIGPAPAPSARVSYLEEASRQHSSCWWGDTIT